MRKMNKIEKGILKELEQIESEHKDDEELKQAVKRIKDLMGLQMPYSKKEKRKTNKELDKLERRPNSKLGE